MRKILSAAVIAAALLLPACSSSPSKFPTAESGLDLSRVVLYRNGVGYFERRGHVDGDTLYLKVRKDHVNDLLKSLTVVERAGGKAVSVSMPLDPDSWANVAASTLAPGRGSLAQVLDALRGTWVQLKTDDVTATGRILMVEQFNAAPTEKEKSLRDEEPLIDHRVTVLDDGKMQVVKLSDIRSVTLKDGDVSMAFHRSLDASAGQGMFQQIELAIRLVGKSSKDIVVSYVAPAPMWKPTYRVVLPEKPGAKALLQAWAVVDNTTGEDWSNVQLALTSCAPIAFEYDLHTPRDVDRPDLSGADVRKRAHVAVGETSFEEAAPMASEPAVAESSTVHDEMAQMSKPTPPSSMTAARNAKKQAAREPAKEETDDYNHKANDYDANKQAAPLAGHYKETPAVDTEALRQSTLASTRATTVSGLTRYDITDRVTVPEGSSTMVAIINQPIDAEETFMFQPGGAGMGYESNPYRVIRFRNTTPFVLETGPISIYASNSFVGEGISQTVGANTSVTIPFAVEPGILVTSSIQRSGDETRLLRLVRGTLEVERFAQTTTTWNIRSQLDRPQLTIYLRQPKQSPEHKLQNRPKGTEDLADAYLIPVTLSKGMREAQLEVTEQTPSRLTMSLWDGNALSVLDTVMMTGKLSSDTRAKLQPIVTARREIGRLDTQIDGLTKRRRELDQRAKETRDSLRAIQKDTAAGALRTRLNKRLEEFTSEADKIGREIVDLQSKRLEKKIELEDAIQSLDLKL